MMISQFWRRGIRLFFAFITAIGAGTLALPDYVPAILAHNIQQTDVFLTGFFVIVLNPWLDIGADDAKFPTTKS